MADQIITATAIHQRARARQRRRERVLGWLASIYRMLQRSLTPVSRWIQRRWEPVGPVVDIVRHTRVASLSVLAGMLVITLTGQGQEMMLLLAEPIAGDPWLGWLGWLVWLVPLHITVVCWALACGLSARLNLNTARSVRTMRGRPPDWANGWFDWNWPRVLLYACFLVYLAAIVVALARFDGTQWPLVGLLVVDAGLVFATYTALRIRAEFKQRQQPSKRIKALIVASADRLEGAAVVTALAGFVVSTVVFACWPATAGQRIGSPVLLFGFLAISTAILGRLSRVFHASRFPILTAIVVCPLCASLSPWNDNHQVRPLSTLGAGQGQSEIRTALQAWQDSPASSNCIVGEGADARRRLIVVATAGGGLRAAYWTAVVLGSLQDRLPHFRDCLFAISGVSGGSLGAVLFTAALDESDHGNLSPDASCQDRGNLLVCRLDGALSRDFLGASAGAMLFPDLVQRFLPWPTIFSDRAEALERAWEVGFARDGSSPLESDFLSLWQPDRFRLPHLLLNGTDADTGTRIVTGSLKLVDTFPETLDYFDLSRAGIRLSTAAMNSARFTYVSPAGTIFYPPDMANAGQVRARVIDGGYFENYGAQTAFDLLQALSRIDRAVDPDKPAIDFTVIQISSDPELPPRAEPDPRDCAAGIGETAVEGEGVGRLARMTSRFANEIRAPIRGLLMTRESRGLLAAKQLACAASGPDQYVHFRMKPKPREGSWLPAWMGGGSAEQPPLGWLLTRHARDQIAEQLHADCTTVREFNRVLAMFGEKPQVDQGGNPPTDWDHKRPGSRPDSCAELQAKAGEK